MALPPCLLNGASYAPEAGLMARVERDKIGGIPPVASDLR
jgi:hypothetical protein